MTAFPLLLLAGALACAADVAGPPAPSEAEKIARLQRAIEADEKQRGVLEAELARPKGEYQEALTAFQALDDKLGVKKKAVGRLKDVARKPVVASLAPAAAVVAID